MKELLLVLVLALVGCTSQPTVAPGCPPIEQLRDRDPVADARAALARGDDTLLMLGGFVGTVPGVDDPEDAPTRLVDGTTDTESEKCLQMRGIAEAYATKYNRTIANAHQD